MAERKPGELFQCRKCKAVYPHDQGYRHDLYECPKRKEARDGRPVEVGLG